jgi:hypothetical protein
VQLSDSKDIETGRNPMINEQKQGGFAGEPATALKVTGTGGCCGNPAQATDVLAAERPAADSSPCCGTQAEAAASSSCCGAGAKAEAVAAGSGCCG